MALPPTTKHVKLNYSTMSYVIAIGFGRYQSLHWVLGIRCGGFRCGNMLWRYELNGLSLGWQSPWAINRLGRQQQIPSKRADWKSVYCPFVLLYLVSELIPRGLLDWWIDSTSWLEIQQLDFAHTTTNPISSKQTISLSSDNPKWYWHSWRISSKSSMKRLRARQPLLSCDGLLMTIRARDDTTINRLSGSIKISIATIAFIRWRW